MSEALYVVLALGLIVAYLLLTVPTVEERQAQRRQEIRRIAAQMDRERQQITATARQRIAAASREAYRHSQRRR